MEPTVAERTQYAMTGMLRASVAAVNIPTISFGVNDFEAHIIPKPDLRIFQPF